MTVRSKVWMTFAVILLLAVLAGVVDYPKGPNIRIGSFFKELKLHLGLDLQGGAQLIYQADTSSIPNDDLESALQGTRDVIERRVNTFGVAEPVVQTSKVGDEQRVIVELPGVTDVNQAIARIGETPLLEFREQQDPEEQEPLTEEEQQYIDQQNAEALATAQLALDRVLAGDDFATVANEVTDDPGNTDADGNQQGGFLDFADPEQYVPEFRDALVALEDGQTTQELVQTQYGYHIIRREATREVENEDGTTTTEVQARHILVRTVSEADLRQANPNFVPTGLAGQHLRRAEVVFDPNTGEPQVSLVFNDEGKKLFAEITKRNVGQYVAIYLDGEPISIPTVQQEITAGEAVITGSFTLTEAKDLAARLNAGALPVPITLIGQQNVGATLGQVSVQRSFVAGLLGMVLVALFMMLYYRFPGVLAVFSLAFYALIVIAIFKLWPVTLTLAGIAGFILSIGLAVDANILIFERFKEELRGGKPLGVAIEQGFDRAWPSIRDANVSSIITSVILAWFGTSLIQGFAITLALGIFVSMFTAFFVTRTLLRLFQRSWLARRPGLIGSGIQKHEETQ